MHCYVFYNVFRSVIISEKCVVNPPHLPCLCMFIYALACSLYRGDLRWLVERAKEQTTEQFSRSYKTMQLQVISRENKAFGRCGSTVEGVLSIEITLPLSAKVTEVS